MKPIHEVTDAALAMFAGMVRSNAELQHHMERQRQDFYREVEAYLLRVGFPARLVALRKFSGEQWLGKRKALSAALMGSGTTWLLRGGRGTGKTTMATVVARVVARSGKSARFVSANAMLVEVRNGFGATMSKFTSPHLLVVDEVGERSKPTAWEMDTMTAVVRTRHDNALDTLLTTNGTTAETLRRLGPSIQSRLCDGGGVMVFDWRSFRHG